MVLILKAIYYYMRITNIMPNDNNTCSLKKVIAKSPVLVLTASNSFDPAESKYRDTVVSKSLGGALGGAMLLYVYENMRRKPKS